MGFLRRSARCSRLEKLQIMSLEKMNIKNSVLDYIRYKQLNWYGHVPYIKRGIQAKGILKQDLSANISSQEE